MVFAKDGATVAYLSSSSKRYKDHIADMTLEEAQKILDIPVIWFKYKDGYLNKTDWLNGKKLPGFYAEDVYSCFPQATQLNENGEPEELAAGTYHVTPKNGWSGGMGNGKTYQFTLTKAVPKGGQIVWNGAWDQDPLKYDIKTYTSPNTGADSNRVKYKNGSPQWQWERTPNAGGSYGVRGVGGAGYLNSSNANNSSGVAPACNVI